MSLKNINDKPKLSSYSYGQGGAAYRSKSREHKRHVVDPDIRPIPRMLEVETARNRLTTSGRGGMNVYHHVIEPGVFQRVIDHETARIVAIKAEEKANKLYEERRKRTKSTSSREYHHDMARPGARLRSGSTSTFATSTSGSSASASHPSSSSSFLPSSLTRSVTPTSSITSKLLSPLKRYVNGGVNSYLDFSGRQSHKNTASEGIGSFEDSSSSLTVLPRQRGSVCSSLLAPVARKTTMPPGIGLSTDGTPPYPSSTASSPRLFSHGYQSPLECQGYPAPYNLSPYPSKLKPPPRTFTQSTPELSVNAIDNIYHHKSLSRHSDKADKGLGISPTRSLITDIGQELLPWRKCLVDRPTERSEDTTARVAERVHGGRQGLASNLSPSTFTPYHLPSRTNIKRHSRLFEITPGNEDKYPQLDDNS
ncbi:hypothetical protein FRB91_009348 [Serendipita sp. 411]|nr:hypothetical protein FRC15_009125 [Serendipita sp. 397]KAG8850107.1 hypothetical protein FRB91_009348 [Serendipita sp. 411]KAG8867132.1 hypothetical protein FRC20_006627 [Serendipita sp. 405]